MNSKQFSFVSKTGEDLVNLQDYLQGYYSPYSQNEVAIYINIGQSNSEGGPGECAGDSFSPLKNVFTVPYPSDGSDNYKWISFRDSDINCGRTFVLNRSNPSQAFALKWQSRIDEGKEILPDLYIIEVAWGGQAISPRIKTGNNRWSPLRKGVDSLFLRVQSVIYWAIEDLMSNGFLPRFLGAIWVQGEADCVESSIANEYKANLMQIYNAIVTAAAVPALTFWIVRCRSPREKYHKIIEKAEVLLSTQRPLIFKILDPFMCPTYDPSGQPEYGIYVSDGVHYQKIVQNWFADEILKQTIGSGVYGVVCQHYHGRIHPQNQCNHVCERLLDANHFDNETYLDSLAGGISLEKSNAETCIKILSHPVDGRTFRINLKSGYCLAIMSENTAYYQKSELMTLVKNRTSFGFAFNITSQCKESLVDLSHKFLGVIIDSTTNTVRLWSVDEKLHLLDQQILTDLPDSELWTVWRCKINQKNVKVDWSKDSLNWNSVYVASRSTLPESFTFGDLGFIWGLGIAGSEEWDSASYSQFKYKIYGRPLLSLEHL